MDKLVFWSPLGCFFKNDIQLSDLSFVEVKQIEPMEEMSTDKIPIDKVKYAECTFQEAESTIEKHNWKFYAKDSTGNEVGKADCVVGEIR